MYTKQDLEDLNSIRYTPHTLGAVASMLIPGFRILMEVIEFPDKTIIRYHPQRFVEPLYGWIEDRYRGEQHWGICRPAGWLYLHNPNPVRKHQTVHFPTIQEAIDYIVQS